MSNRDSSMRTIYLHIGQHKTGTTQIQLALGRNHNSSALKENGFEFPILSRQSDHGYLHSYILDIQNGRECEAESLSKVNNLIEHISNSDSNIIISAEGLQEVKPSCVRDLFSGYQVVVVAYIREQADYLFSAYQQEVKCGNESGSFSEYFYRLGSDVGVYYLNSWIAEWEKVFGEEFVILRRYQASALVNGDIVSDFLTVVGLADLIPIIVEKEISNKRVDVNCHMGMQLVNSLGIPGRVVLSGVYDLIESRSSRPGDYLGCDQYIISEIRRRSEWQNNMLAARRFGEEKLFSFRAIPAEVMYSPLKVLAFIFWMSIGNIGKRPFFSGLLLYRFILNIFRALPLLLDSSRMYGCEYKLLIIKAAQDGLMHELDKTKAYNAHLERVLKCRDQYISHLKGE